MAQKKSLRIAAQAKIESRFLSHGTEQEFNTHCGNVAGNKLHVGVENSSLGFLVDINVGNSTRI